MTRIRYHEIPACFVAGKAAHLLRKVAYPNPTDRIINFAQKCVENENEFCRSADNIAVGAVIKFCR